MPLHPLELGQVQAYLAKISKPNLLNSLLRTLTLNQLPRKVLLIYNQMVQLSSHDHFTYTYALKAASLLLPNATHKGHEIHARVLKSGHHADLFIQNALINFYSSAADVASVRRAFAGIARPDVVSWTSLVSALARSGREAEALAAFASMDARPNPMTLVSVLPACSRLKGLNLGKSIHAFGLRTFGGHGSNLILDNAILEMYVRCGDLVAARHLFGEMAGRDVVSWTTLIAGYARNQSSEEAIAVFSEMLWDGETAPNEATLVSVLRACASLGALRFGKCVHSCFFKNCIGVDGLVGNALVNFYAKCGDVGMSGKVFTGISCRDLVSWCTMIWGMAMNGRGKQALQLFASMLCQGVRPDGLAFLAVLSACCHAGLVDQGLMIFRAMSEVYGIMPQKEHYTCMVDAYGRAGKLKEAESLVQGMPAEIDGHAWGALLSSCSLLGGDKVESESLSGQVLEGDVSVGGGMYALVSNMLASGGRWESSHSVRELMKARRIRKIAGCSWIELH
ncbi:putative pentatricopeptide repeat-containing protein At3g05240 [Elaeis guineensis]